MPVWRKILEGADAGQRLPHALLLSGPSLSALRSVAQAIAQKALDHTGSVAQHADYFEVAPANKMRQIGVDAVRDLMHDLQKSSYCGAGKVAVIVHAERMNRVAANTFLKTLEEPSAGTHLLLLSTQPRGLLPTVRSRCVQVRVLDRDPPLEDPQWAQWLQHFRAWLVFLKTASRIPAGRARAIMTCYGLIASFLEIESTLADALWKAQKATLGELPEDTLAALEVTCHKDLLAQLIAALAQSMSQVWRAERNPRAYCDSMQALAQVSGLLEVNLPEASALELFFLKTLRAWSRGSS